MRWFGPSPWGPICSNTPRVEAPIGKACLWCEEPIAPGDCGVLMPTWAGESLDLPTGRTIGVFHEIAEHQECLVRQVVGVPRADEWSVCGCVHLDDHAPPKFKTRREEARWVFQFHHCILPYSREGKR